MSRTYGSRAAGSAFVQLFVAPVLALELGGGSYLPDPYQGLPRARYVSAGIRLHANRCTPRTAPRPTDPPLIPAWRSDSVTVRFRMEGATSVALAGDWNEWRPMPLRRSGEQEWEGQLGLPPGAYHFVLMVDGKEWVVPKGVATVPDAWAGLRRSCWCSRGRGSTSPADAGLRAGSCTG